MGETFFFFALRGGGASGHFALPPDVRKLPHCALHECPEGRNRWNPEGQSDISVSPHLLWPFLATSSCASIFSGPCDLRFFPPYRENSHLGATALHCPSGKLIDSDESWLNLRTRQMSREGWHLEKWSSKRYFWRVHFLGRVLPGLFQPKAFSGIVLNYARFHQVTLTYAKVRWVMLSYLAKTLDLRELKKPGPGLEKPQRTFSPLPSWSLLLDNEKSWALPLSWLRNSAVHVHLFKRQQLWRGLFHHPLCRVLQNKPPPPPKLKSRSPSHLPSLQVASARNMVSQVTPVAISNDLTNKRDWPYLSNS